MKITSTTITWLIMGFIWSIFMGVTAISIGLGAVFPSINLIAKPFICPNGQLNYEKNVSNPLPGTTYIQTFWNCVDNQSGVKKNFDPVTIGLYAGPFYGLLLFVVVCVIWYAVARWDDRLPASKNITRAQQYAKDAKQYAEEAEQYDKEQTEQYHVNSAADDRRARKAAAQWGRDRQDAEARLKKLKELHASNMISDAEYSQKRAEIIKEL